MNNKGNIFVEKKPNLKLQFKFPCKIIYHFLN